MKDRLIIVIKCITFPILLLLVLAYMLTIVFPTIEWIILGDKSITSRSLKWINEFTEEEKNRGY